MIADCDVLNFEMNLVFLTKPFFLHDQKVMIKISIPWERKELLRWNKKHSSSYVKVFQWSKELNFLECESPTVRKIYWPLNFTTDISMVTNTVLRSFDILNILKSLSKLKFDKLNLSAETNILWNELPRCSNVYKKMVLKKTYKGVPL